MFVQALRTAVSKPSTSIQLCIVGLLAGLIAASVIIAFRWGLYFLQDQVLGGAGKYSALPNWQLCLLPIIAVILIITIARITGFKHYRLGIPFVIHRFKLHYGHIPLGTSVNQFFGGILALASGFVVGKEGPSVHLAAAASHYIGRWFSLPFNSLRIIAGCGIAAGIAAAFNTPFAAVIFVMEVVTRDYKLHIFVPVMLAAATGSVLTRLVFGDVAELGFLSFQSMPNWHYPVLVVLGICLGVLAAIFNRSLMTMMRLFSTISMITRLFIAGFVTALFGFFMPEALGTEFVNVQTFMQSSPAALTILMLFAAKLCLAIVAISLGVPGGIIGAVMVIGMLAGLAFLQPLMHLVQMISADTVLEDIALYSNYALFGLAGLLAAVLHAPLAALSAVMELSSSHQIVLPALITIVTAYVTSKQLCKNRSIFIQQLEFQNLPYTTNAIREDLQETGVLALMSSDFVVSENASEQQLLSSLKDAPETIALDYSYSANGGDWHLVNLKMGGQQQHPVMRTKVHILSQQHTLAEVYEILVKQRSGAVAIVRDTGKQKALEATSEIRSTSQSSEQIEDKMHNDSDNSILICGVITWSMLHAYLFRQQH